MTDDVEQWMGNLFYRGVCPSIIKAMGYRELQYWNSWHELMIKAERKAMTTPKGNR